MSMVTPTPGTPKVRYSYASLSNTAMLIWLFILVTFLSVRERETSQLMSDQGFDLQIKLQIAGWLGLGALAAYLIGRGRLDLKLLLRAPICWYFAYAVLAVGSTSYSLSPALTLFRSGQLLTVLFLILAIRDRLDRIYLMIFVFIVINWVFVLMANLGLDFGQTWIRGPDNLFMIFGDQSSVQWRFSSPLAHASQVSIVGSAGAVGLAMRTNREKLWENLPVILFFVLTVLLTISRTAIASMFIGLMLVLVIRRKTLPLLLVSGVVLPFALLFTPVGEKVVQFGMRGQSAEEFRSLTGRSEIYAHGIDRAKASLPFGEGFVAGRAKAIVAKDKGRSIVHSHNLFIESAVGMGFLGVVLAAMVLIALGRSLLMVIKLKPDDSGVSPGWEPFVMSLPILAFCILDRGFASPVSPFACLFIVVLLMTTDLLVRLEEENSGEAVDSSIAVEGGAS